MELGYSEGETTSEHTLFYVNSRSLEETKNENYSKKTQREHMYVKGSIGPLCLSTRVRKIPTEPPLTIYPYRSPFFWYLRTKRMEFYINKNFFICEELKNRWNLVKDYGISPTETVKTDQNMSKRYLFLMINEMW